MESKTRNVANSHHVPADQTLYVPTADKNRFQLVEHLSPVVYVQSSCDAPSERDSYVQELMNYINIDSYGQCLNNKQLPVQLRDAAESMNDAEFLKLMAKYKFTIAFENAIGDDYMTEKLWRPIHLGSIPVYMGSPLVKVSKQSFSSNSSSSIKNVFFFSNGKDWTPNNQSVIIASDFASPESLAQYLRNLNENETAYEEFLSHKLSRRVSNQNLINAMEIRSWSDDDDDDDDDDENFVEAFECFLCQQIHEKTESELHGYSPRPALSIDSSHFNCGPLINPVSKRVNPESWWVQHWQQAGIEARTTSELCTRNQNYSSEEYHNSVFENLQPADNWSSPSVQLQKVADSRKSFI